MRKSLRPLFVLLAPFALTYCGDKDLNNLNNVPLPLVPVNGTVGMYDQCDSVSFNATLGAGTCTTAGSVTLDQFTAELTATQSVAAWHYTPTALAITLGGTIQATNFGGEVHTFTAVSSFGGGIVPALNSASGNPIEAPECQTITDADKVAPGASTTTPPAGSVGVHRYQCCIHPWMRETVTVTGP